MLISGPTGTGRSTLFRAATQTLIQKQAPLVDLAENNAHRAPTPSVTELTLAYDGIEHACPTILRRLIDHHDGGGSSVLTVNSSRWHATLPRENQVLLEELRAHEHYSRSLQEVHLVPLHDEAILQLIHTQGSRPVDSATADAIKRFAFGRPAWAMDLLELHDAQKLVAGPYPQIPHVPLEKLHVPALQRLAEVYGQLPDEIKAAAIALSEVDPLDEHGTAALAGQDFVEHLTQSGALIPIPGRETVTVPQFIAAAIAPQVSRQLVLSARRSIATRLLRQEALGIPLSERDSEFCANTLEASQGTDAPPAQPEQTSVLSRTLANYLTFSEPVRARALLFSFDTLGEKLDCMTRARMLAVLGKTQDAAQVLESPELRTDARTLTSAHFLHSVLTAENEGGFEEEVEVASGPDLSTYDEDSPRRSFDVDHTDAFLTFRLWNSTGSIRSHVPQLQRIANEHPDRRVGYLAGSLIDLDAVWHGKAPSPLSWFTEGRRVPTLRLHSECERDLVSTVLGAHSLIVLLSGYGESRQAELFEAAQKLPAPYLHERWLRHLLASGSAATFGDVERARTEWNMLEAHAPRFFPLRLRWYLDAIARSFDAILSDDPPSPNMADSLPYRLMLFFTGQHHELQQMSRETATASDVLPMIQLANDQLAASQFRNPVALQRCADRFQDHEMWLPAAFALIDARRVYISRRASRKVIECDQALESVWRNAMESAPWYSGEPDALQPPEQLTARELETAQLAARGLRNREIAEQLGCKVRTVESHLAQARAKIGASSRQEIAEILSRLQL